MVWSYTHIMLCFFIETVFNICFLRGTSNICHIYLHNVKLFHSKCFQLMGTINSCHIPTLCYTLSFKVFSTYVLKGENVQVTDVTVIWSDTHVMLCFSIQTLLKMCVYVCVKGWGEGCASNSYNNELVRYPCYVMLFHSKYF